VPGIALLGKWGVDRAFEARRGKKGLRKRRHVSGGKREGSGETWAGQDGETAFLKIWGVLKEATSAAKIDHQKGIARTLD